MGTADLTQWLGTHTQSLRMSPTVNGNAADVDDVCRKNVLGCADTGQRHAYLCQPMIGEADGAARRQVIAVVECASLHGLTKRTAIPQLITGALPHGGWRHGADTATRSAYPNIVKTRPTDQSGLNVPPSPHIWQIGLSRTVAVSIHTDANDPKQPVRSFECGFLSRNHLSNGAFETAQTRSRQPCRVMEK